MILRFIEVIRAKKRKAPFILIFLGEKGDGNLPENRDGNVEGILKDLESYLEGDMDSPPEGYRTILSEYIQEMEVSPELYFRRPFTRNYSIDSEELESLRKEDFKVRARDISLSYLDRGMKSRKEVEKKLKDSSIPQEIISDTVERIEDYGYLDDEQLARNYIGDRIRTKGKIRVRQELLEKGIDKETIENLFTEEVRDEEFGNLLEAAARKHRSLKVREKDSRRLKDKLMRFLIGRGYEYDMIRRAMDRVLTEDTEDDSEDYLF